MPYKSDAQRRYFHYLESKGKMPKKVVDEYDAASKGADLPEYVEQHAEGGEVGNDPYAQFGKNVAENAGNTPAAKKVGKSFLAHGGEVEEDVIGDYHPNVSSGEPHTNEFEEEEHPMEYMSIGGSVGNVKGGGLFGLAHGGEARRMGHGPAAHHNPHHMEEMPHLAFGGLSGSIQEGEDEAEFGEEHAPGYSGYAGSGPAAHVEKHDEVMQSLSHSGEMIDHGPASENEHHDQMDPKLRKKMAAGGMVRHAFAKALAKSRGMK